MGDLVVQQFVTVDGFAADAQNEFTLFDKFEGDTAEFEQSNLAWLEHVDAIVLGANTYRMFAGYWPTPASEKEIVAPKINSLPKFVFSRTLSEAPWGDYAPATVESGDAVEAVQRIKRDFAGDVITWGSMTLTATFFDAGEVGRLRLVYVPVAIGAGRGVFPPQSRMTRLRLESSKVFQDGLVEHEYIVLR